MFRLKCLRAKVVFGIIISDLFNKCHRRYFECAANAPTQLNTNRSLLTTCLPDPTRRKGGAGLQAPPYTGAIKST